MLALLAGLWPAASLGQAAPAPGPQCQEALRGLHSYLQRATPPERPFVRIQLRVVERGCASLGDFEDPQWFQNTVELFIAGFLAQGGDWPALIRGCQARWEPDLSCVGQMVFQHIHADLLPAIRRHGCGSARDWNRVGGLVLRAAADEGQVWGLGAALFVPAERYAARRACLRGED